MSKLRVGVIGTGWVATARHLPPLRSNEEVDVVALLDHSITRARAAGRGREQVTDDLDVFLSLDLDLIDICTSPWDHSSLAVLALERGSHVLCEKPMAVSLTDAELMARAASAADGHLVVCHNFLFSRSFKRLTKWRARLGDVRYVAATQLSSVDRRLPTWHEKLPGGLFADELPHMLYTLSSVAGDLTIGAVRSTRRSSARPTVIEVNLDGDVPARLTTVLDAPVSEWHVTIVGERGVVDLDLFRDIAVFVPTDGAHRPVDILRTSGRAIGGHAAGFLRSGVQLVRRRQFWGHDELIRGTVDACLGRQDPPVSVHAAIKVARLAQSILDEVSSA